MRRAVDVPYGSVSYPYQVNWTAQKETTNFGIFWLTLSHVSCTELKNQFEDPKSQ